MAAIKRDVRITRPDKEMYAGITKRMVADYYRSISESMLSFLRDRPLVLERFPEGIEKDGFYQKNASDYFPDWIEQVEVKKEGGSVSHVVCNDAETLLYLANQDCLTFHTWLCCTDDLDKPDLMVFDLDPQRDDDFASVREGAVHLRDLLSNLDLECFVQTTGSRGLHVDVALDRRETFDEVRGLRETLRTRWSGGSRDASRPSTASRRGTASSSIPYATPCPDDCRSLLIARQTGGSRRDAGGVARD